MKQLVAIDPGGTTGIAWNNGSEYLSANHVIGERHHLSLYELLYNIMPDVLIYERFDHRQGKWRAKVDLRAREYIGVCELFAEQTDCLVVRQSPMSHDRGLWTDEKLERAGVLVKPASVWPHANDALRHLLYYMTTALDSDTKKYWLAKGTRDERS